MRSRYSAYCIGDFQYIFDTYGESQKLSLSVGALKESGSSTQWIGLEVLEHNVVQGDRESVRFKAYYLEAGQVFLLHELSYFEQQSESWRYTEGDMQADTGKIKLSRNDLCPCQSGKKYKQCCMKAGLF